MQVLATQLVRLLVPPAAKGAVDLADAEHSNALCVLRRFRCGVLIRCLREVGHSGTIASQALMRSPLSAAGRLLAWASTVRSRNGRYGRLVLEPASMS